MKQEITQLGSVDWTNDDIRRSIPEFLKLYHQKPVGDNQGGMKTPHMLATWFMLQKLNPSNVIESGVWKGQGTWLIEQAVPNANIFSIDVRLKNRQYKSDKAKYFTSDFFDIDWSEIKDKENTVIFFDDHQNGFARIEGARKMGFKYFIFEDNYPANQGDCYSLKKAFQHAGHEPVPTPRNIKSIIHQIIKPSRNVKVEPNAADSAYLKDVLEIYYEFPPAFKKDKTRWGESWDSENYFTPEPLFQNLEDQSLKVFEKEAMDYTWICLAKLK